MKLYVTLFTTVAKATEKLELNEQVKRLPLPIKKWFIPMIA